MRYRDGTRLMVSMLLASNLLSVDSSLAQTQLPPVELRPALLDAENEAEEYRLGPGDILSITDMTPSTDGHPVTSTAQVLPDGTASIFPIGLMRVAGKTLRALTEDARQRYLAIAKSPDFVIGLAQTRPVEVYILGEVVNPGRYRGDGDRGDSPLTLSAVPFSGAGDTNQTATPHKSKVLDYLLPFSPAAAVIGAATSSASAPVPVAQGKRYGGNTARILTPTTLTAITALQLAGGVKETADIRHIVVRRRGQSALSVDLWAVLVDGDASRDIVLKPDDVVVVPKGNTPFQAEALGLTASQSRVVRVFGGIRQPGIYELSPQDDVLSIISRAGGFTPAAVQGKVWLSRKLANGQVRTQKVSIPRSMKHYDYVGRSPLASGDIVEVKESIVKKVAPTGLTIGATFLSAFMILYFSRRIVDKSQPNQQQSSGTLTQTNGGPLGLPSVF